MLPAFAGGASAEALSGLAGTYGNANGCKYEATGNYIDEDMVILKADEYQTYVTLCEFLEVRVARDGSQVVTALCGHEGDEAQTIDFMRFVKDRSGRDAFAIFGQGGDPYGEVEPCR
jgi:hypothetical protein